MSRVTDLVFIYPAEPDDWRDDESGTGPYCPEFEAMYARHQTHPCLPVAEHGKASGTAVYNLGVNYLKPELAEEIQTHQWPAGTVLYLSDEHEHAPTVTVWPARVVVEGVDLEGLT